jgi:hypothetical protein
MNRFCGWIIPRCSSEIPEPAPTAPETVDAITKEVRRMAEDGPTKQELDEAKSYLKGSQMLALDTLIEAGVGAAAIPARSASDRLHREAQRHRRCSDAGRRQEGRPTAVGARPSHCYRRPRPAGRSPARRSAPARGGLSSPFRTSHMHRHHPGMSAIALTLEGTLFARVSKNVLHIPSFEARPS